MTLYSSWIIFPEGDSQEIQHKLRINQLVDLNGNPLPLPLPTPKMIVYRVFRISTEIMRGEEKILHHLELMRRDELEDFAV
jgi:hypothetical protein